MNSKNEKMNKKRKGEEKEVDESKLNYNRFPGEQVIAVEDIVKVVVDLSSLQLS